jgi:hypothetical protein
MPPDVGRRNLFEKGVAAAGLPYSAFHKICTGNFPATTEAVSGDCTSSMPLDNISDLVSNDTDRSNS